MQRADFLASSQERTSSKNVAQITDWIVLVRQNQLFGYNFQSSAQPLPALGTPCFDD